MTNETTSPNPFTKYQFIDEQGHALENCVAFTELKQEIEFLTDTAAKYSRSKQSYNIMDRSNKIRAKWGLDEKRI